MRPQRWPSSDGSVFRATADPDGRRRSNGSVPDLSAHMRRRSIATSSVPSHVTLAVTERRILWTRSQRWHSADPERSANVNVMDASGPSAVRYIAG